MSRQEVQVIMEALSEAIAEDGSVDMMGVMRDAPPARFVEAVDPDAEIRFFTAGGGTIGDMAETFIGIEGFRAGWREWTKPFESFTATIEGIESGAEGRVLLLVQTRARLSGAGPEVIDHTAALYTVREERIVAIDHYLDQGDARRAAGIDGAGEEQR